MEQFKSIVGKVWKVLK